jgi:hypothetical protein
MYVWIWRRLPGGLLGKLAGALVLVVVAVAVLFLVVFPWVGPKLPYNHATVDAPRPAHTSAPEVPSGRSARM